MLIKKRMFAMMFVASIFCCSWSTENSLTKQCYSEESNYSQPQNEDVIQLKSKLNKVSLAVCIPVWQTEARYTHDLIASLQQGYNTLKANAPGCEMRIYFRNDTGEQSKAAEESKVITEELASHGLTDISSVMENAANCGVMYTRIMLQDDAMDFLFLARDAKRIPFITFIDSDDTINKKYFLFGLLTALKYSATFINLEKAIRNFDDQSMEEKDINSPTVEQLREQDYEYGDFKASQFKKEDEHVGGGVTVFMNCSKLLPENQGEFSVIWSLYNNDFKQININECCFLYVEENKCQNLEYVDQRNLYVKGLYNYRTHQKQISQSGGEYEKKEKNHECNFLNNAITSVRLLNWMLQFAAEQLAKEVGGDQANNGVDKVSVRECVAIIKKRLGK